MHIRKFQKADLGDVKQLIDRTVSTCYPKIYPPVVVEFFINYHSEKEILRRAGEGLMIVMLLDSKIVGTGFLVGEEMGGVYILPELQRCGYGSKIVDYLIQQANRLKLQRIWLDSTPIARPMYEKFGFAIVKEAVDYVGNNVPLNYFVMEKRLSVAGLEFKV